MVSTSQFKSGMIIRYNNDLCEILEFQLVKMQQRQPIVRTRMKNIKNGNVLEQAFRSGDKFEDIYLEEKPLQFLYREGNKFHFMDSESYHQVTVDAPILGENINYIKENSDVIGKYHGEEMLSIVLPASVILTIAETEPGVRGDTAKSGTKQAKLETGAMIKVPLFVNSGEQIRVDTRTGQYLERA